MRYKGYMGSYLDVDLSTRAIGRREISEQEVEQFLGGKGLGAKLLYDELAPGVDPLSPDNLMIVNTGPLTGSGAPCSARFNITTKNAMTHGIGSSNCGGDFGLYLKKAGYDGLIVRGRAERPTWLEIRDDQVVFHDARHLWGQDTEKTQGALGRYRGKLAIGPAGENLVRFAAVMSGDRAAGRCGVGAVMGSKLLKAVTVTGTRRVAFHDRDRFRAHIQAWIRALRSHPTTGGQLPKLGTAGLVNITSASNTICHRNFQDGTWERADEVSGETLAERHLVKNGGCRTCPIRCGRFVRVEGRTVKGPEFETIGMFGPNIENADLALLNRWNWLMDLYGIDTISCGSTIAFATELAERGMLDADLRFGRTDRIEQLLADIAYRRGLGDELAEGSLRLSRRYGGADFTNQVKGMEYAAYEPRGAVGHGLGYAVANRGGCHLNGGYVIYFETVGPVTADPLSPKAKPGLVVFQQNAMEAVSSSGNCLFTTYAVIPGIANRLIKPSGAMAKVVSSVILSSGPVLGLQGKMGPGAIPFHLPMIPHSRAVELLTGMELSAGRFLAMGERGYTIERLFNLREGIGRAADALPGRMTNELQRPDEPRSKVPMDVLLPGYYRTRAWDGDGLPTGALLDKLAMDRYRGELEAIRAALPERAARREELIGAEAVPARRRQPELFVYNDGVRERGAELAVEIGREENIRRAQQVIGHRFSVDPSRCHSCGRCAIGCPTKSIAWERKQAAVINEQTCVKCGTCDDLCPDYFSAIIRTPDPKLLAAKRSVRYRVIDDKCTMCGLCFKACPRGAVAWQKRQKARIDDDPCVRCGLCFKACPEKFGAIEVVTAG